jgi:hypothetical protein
LGGGIEDQPPPSFERPLSACLGAEDSVAGFPEDLARRPERANQQPDHTDDKRYDHQGTANDGKARAHRGGQLEGCSQHEKDAARARKIKGFSVRFVTRQLGPKRSAQTHQTQHDQTIVKFRNSLHLPSNPKV